jgi:hypothetical protein
MGRSSKHTSQINLANQARAAAFRRLVAVHRDEYDTIYADEAEKRGIMPRSRKKATAARLDEVRRALGKDV